MKKRYFLQILLAIFINIPVVRAEGGLTAPHVVIAAVQTATASSTGDDFIVIHNPTDEAIDMTGWKIQYRAAAATGTAGWVTKLVCQNDCVTDAHANLIASTYNIEGLTAHIFSGGFSASGGQLQLVAPIANSTNLHVVDGLGYGSAAESEGDKPAAAPAAGQVLVRKTNDTGAPVDTDVNADDFTIGCYKPLADGIPVADTCTDTSTDNNGDNTATNSDGTDTSQTGTVNYLSLNISELLPDPASPAQDTSDEFIEIYNPNAEAVNIKGYTLQTGSDFKYHFTFGDDTIASGGYLVIYSADSNLSLSNSGTPVRLLAPSGSQIDSIASYGSAKTGQAWALISGVWQWTTIPTPGAPNQATPAAPVTVATAATIKPKAAKAIKTAAAKTALVSKTQAKKTAAAVKPIAKTKKVSSASSSPAASDSNTSYWLFGALGLGLLGYAGYEYRQDIVRLARRAIAATVSKKAVGSGQQSASLPETTLQTD